MQMKGIFITGTDTHVGKTWVSKQLIELLIQQGIDVVPRKPVESGWQSDVTLSDAWG
ncbi:MAG TPA: dethiobiotin synthase, partial [Leucothrix sp.]|nr:dethiobiotin synthase [Leucothrix sp.]